MKNLIKNTILTAFIALTMISCKDDSTSTPVTPVIPVADSSTYFSMKLGTYWIYDNSEFLVDGVTVDEASRSYDSIAVTGTKTISDKLAYTIYRYYSAAGILPINYAHSFTADQLFISDEFLKASPIFDNPLLAGITIPSYGWLKIADTKTATWDLLPTPIEIKDIASPITVDGVTDLKINAAIQVKMKSMDPGTALDPVTKKAVKTITFEMKYEVTGAAKGTTMLGVITAPLSGSYSSYMVYAEGIGLLKSYTPKQKFTIIAAVPLFGNKEIFTRDMKGDESVLRTYKK